MKGHQRLVVQAHVCGHWVHVSNQFIKGLALGDEWVVTCGKCEMGQQPIRRLGESAVDRMAHLGRSSRRTISPIDHVSSLALRRRQLEATDEA